jgi:hypothetical protein
MFGLVRVRHADCCGRGGRFLLGDLDTGKQRSLGEVTFTSARDD